MAKYQIYYTKKFIRQAKLCKKRGYDMNLLQNVISLLSENGCLEAKYNPHKLSGDKVGYMECHIKADWLLIWKHIDNQLILTMTATGTHSDLF
ncbi:MAG: type II toxin-antitoxin system YafQ family toxin [Bacteroidales bacterium]|nr:type II toxin-antitoxin system YafQ family toxin [Bacteroidales bacterium]